MEEAEAIVFSADILPLQIYSPQYLPFFFPVAIFFTAGIIEIVTLEVSSQRIRSVSSAALWLANSEEGV